MGGSISVAGGGGQPHDAGSVAACGMFGGTMTAGNVSIVSKAGGISAFAVRLDSQGEPTWARSFSSNASVHAGTQRTSGVALGQSGQLWVTGHFETAIDFGAGSLLAPAVPSRAFVAKLDQAGNVLGAAEYGSSVAPEQQGSMGDQIVADGAGRAHVVGRFTGAARFDAGLSTSVATTWDSPSSRQRPRTATIPSARAIPVRQRFPRRAGR